MHFFIIYSIYALVEKFTKLKNAVNLSKIIFFSIKHLHAHLQYVCNTLAKHLKDTLKALGVELDFTKYTLSISTMENIL